MSSDCLNSLAYLSLEVGANRKWNSGGISYVKVGTFKHDEDIEENHFTVGHSQSSGKTAQGEVKVERTSHPKAQPSAAWSANAFFSWFGH